MPHLESSIQNDPYEASSLSLLYLQIYLNYYESVPDIKLFILMVAPAVILLVYIKNLDDFAPLSTIANVFSFLALAFLFEVGLFLLSSYLSL